MKWCSPALTCLRADLEVDAGVEMNQNEDINREWEDSEEVWEWRLCLRAGVELKEFVDLQETV